MQMKLERWNPVNNELGGCDVKPVFNGNFVLYDDALAYANEQVKEAKRWKDPEKEMPEKTCFLILKLNNDYSIRYSAGAYVKAENMFYIYDYILKDNKVIGWKEIE